MALSAITLLAVLLTTLVLAVVAGPTFWVAGRLVTGTADPIRWLRRLLVVGLFPVGLVSFGLLWVGGGGETGRALVGRVAPTLAETVVGTVAGTAVSLVGVWVVCLAAYAGTLPAIREVRDLDTGLLRATLAFGRYLAVLFAVVAVVLPVVTAPLSGGSALLAVAGLLVVFPVAGIASPLLIAGMRRTRDPTDAEADRLADATGTASIDAPVRVLVSDDTETVEVHLRGYGRWRRLFVSDYALDALDDRELTALLTLRAEQARHRTLECRQAMALGVIAGALLVGAGPVPTLPGVVGTLVGLGGLVALTRRQGARADRAAGDRVGDETLAETLEHVAELHDSRPARGGLAALVGLSLPTGDRIDRLRES
jgi:STE24 endopeptidase